MGDAMKHVETLRENLRQIRLVDGFKDTPYIRAVVASIALLESSGWRPMSEAPKDGTRVLLHIQGVDRAVLGMWDGNAFATIDGHDWSGRDLLGFARLPLPPMSGSGSAGG